MPLAVSHCALTAVVSLSKELNVTLVTKAVKAKGYFHLRKAPQCLTGSYAGSSMIAEATKQLRGLRANF